jgi:hypothetical protein
MSNGDWRIPPKLGRRLGQVVQNNKREAVEAAKSLTEFCSFLDEKDEDEISRELQEHPDGWETIKRTYNLRRV